MSADAICWFSAADLAYLGKAGIIDIPGSERWAGDRALKLGWLSRKVPGKGGKGGKRTEYQPPADVLAQIHAFVEANPSVFKQRILVLPDWYGKPVYLSSPASPKVAEPAVIHHEPDDAVDTIYVERYKGVNGAAGPGQSTPHDYVIERVEFNPSVARLGVPVKYLRLIHVKGDSMEPTFYDGDEVFVDVRCDRFDDNAIYVIQQDDLTRIKRVQLRLDGSVAIKSDNDGGFPPEIYSAGEAGSFSIIGKVIPWKFGRFKL